MGRNRARTVWTAAAAAMVGVAALGGAADEPPARMAAAIRQLERVTGGRAEVSLHRSTGVARFVRVAPGSLPLPGDSDEARAASFLAEHGALFGLANPATELTGPIIDGDVVGHRRLTYDQVHRGVPVWAAKLRLHLDGAGALVAANGTLVPEACDLDVTPRRSAEEARAIGIAAVQRATGGGASVTADRPTLFVYRTGLVRGVEGHLHLVWKVEVSDGRSIREVVFVDARSGKVVDRIAAAPDGMLRRAYDTELDFPATPFWVEGDAFPTGNNEANKVIEFAEDAYDLFFTAFGYDSWDGAGAVMETVFDRTFDCPNASWNGTYTSYCHEVSGDNLVGHEWTHAYTETTHGLIYQWQPGALNEAYSDIFGEVIDVLNGRGTDTPDAPRSPGGCSTLGGSPPPVLQVTAPPPVAGTYLAGGASYNPPGPITAAAQVTPTSPSDACQPLVGFPSGRIALADRGGCSFSEKTLNAQNAGAIGLIVANNQGDDVIYVSGDGAGIAIPTVFIGQSDGAALRGATGVQATLTIPASSDASVRWLMGEDSPALGRALRDLWSPTCLGCPGKVSDADWYACSADDHGGVHTNMGIPSHAFALLVDGGAYNGRTVGALGLTKAAHLYWRAMSVYQVPASDFADHADALEQACADLVGVTLADLSTGAPSGQIITAADCTEVTDAIAAVELRSAPTSCTFQPLLDPDAPPVSCVAIDFLEEFETDPTSRWTLTNEGVYPEYDPRDWEWTADVPDGGSGSAMFAVDGLDIGDCIPGSDDQSGVMHLDSPSFTVGDGAVLTFDHWVATEAGWDGGNLKVSVNGGPFQLVSAGSFLHNPYNDTLEGSGSTNPLAGQAAFSGSDEGSVSGSWGQSQVDLAAYAASGDAVVLRFDLGVDGCNGLIGWYLDTVRVCSTDAAPPIRMDAASSAATTDDAAVLSWNHTTSGEDRVMLVGVTTRSNRSVTSISYGGQSLSPIRADHPGNDVRAELWSLIAPATGQHTVTVHTSAATTIEAGTTTWTGVGQTPTTAFGANAGSGGTGTTASVDVASTDGEIVVDMVGTQASWATVTAGAGQAERWNHPGAWGVGACSSEAGASAVTMSWTLSTSESWAISAVALRPNGLIFRDGFEFGGTSGWSNAIP